MLEKLGQGGFGTVYKATDDIGRKVAIKVLKARWADDPSTIERFRREAQTAGELFHQRIATIIDFDEANGRLFLVMRYIEGVPLTQIIEEQGRLKWDQAVRILAEVADGLDYAHERGFIHRDIKPANIMVSDREGAVLTDFGLVKAAELSGFTTSGVMIGTPNYIAPEIWEGTGASPATDIYSLACVFYEMITGERLFDGESAPRIMAKHVLEGPQFPETWPEGCFDGVAEVLQRALAKDPATRFKTAGAFVAAIQHLSGEQSRDAKHAARLLLEQATVHLSDGEFNQALDVIAQAEQLVPDLPEAIQLRRRVESKKKQAELYAQVVEHFRYAKEKASDILGESPDYPDPENIFPRLGLRDSYVHSGTAIVAGETRTVKLRFREKVMPYLLIVLGLATSFPFVFGVTGIVAGIGLIKHKEWARKTGLVYAGLLELGGFAGIIALIGYLFIEYMYPGEEIFLALSVSVSIVAILISIFLYQVLGGDRMLKLTAGKNSRPIGLWPVFIGFSATVLGIIPALILLIRDRVSLLVGRYYTISLMVILPILGWAVAADMRTWEPHFSSQNEFGQFLTGIVVLFFLFLCFRALKCLRSQEVRAFYEDIQ